MRAVQGTVLLQRVRQDANLEGSTQNPTDAELVDRLNRAKGEFVDLVRTSGGAGYFQRRTGQLPTSSGVFLYALPSDFVSIVAVLAFLTPTQFIRCTPFTDDMRPMFATVLGTGWVFGQPVYYKLDSVDDAGTEYIEFQPIPTGAFNYQILYQFAPADLVYDSTRGAVTGSMPDVNSWLDYVVARAAAGASKKQKQWDTAAALDAEAERVAERIRQMAPLRDIGAAEVQRDVMRTAPAGYWQEWDQ